MRLLFSDVSGAKQNQSISLKKCGHWGKLVCHSMSRCSFPGVKFLNLNFIFVSILTLDLPQGILWLHDGETLKKPWSLLRFLLVLQMCLLRRPFVCTGTALLSFWASLLFLNTQQNLLPKPKTCRACQPKVHYQKVPPASSSCYGTGLCMEQWVPN